jgi:hypothetical protein
MYDLNHLEQTAAGLGNLDYVAMIEDLPID